MNLHFINRPGIKSGLVLIGPEMAADLVKKQGSNRRLSPRVVSKYAASFTARTTIWQPILLDDRDRVLDGQHRLHAIIESGKTVSCFVISGVPSSVWDDLDQGKSRLLGDVLSAMRVKHSSAIASGLVLVDMYARRNFQGNAVSSRDTLLDIYERNRAAFDAAAEWTSCRRGVATVLGAASICIFINVMLGDINANYDAFWNVMETGAGGKTATEPAVALRNRLLSGQRAAKFTREAKLAMAIKAINAEWRGDPVGVLRYSQSEGMPALFCNFGKEVVA